MSRDLRHELEAAPDDTTRATTWHPAAGDTLVGTVRAITQVPSNFSERPQTCITVLDDDSGSLINVYTRHAVLAREIADQHPAVGDRIALKRLMDDPEKKYFRYKVIVAHAASDDITFAFGANTGHRA